MATSDALAEQTGQAVQTLILPLGTFYLAEEYHQKYFLQGIPEIEDDFRRIYPNADEFIHSTSAARINGYLMGYGSLEDLDMSIGQFGLSERGAQELRAVAQQRTRAR